MQEVKGSELVVIPNAFHFRRRTKDAFNDAYGVPRQANKRLFETTTLRFPRMRFFAKALILSLSKRRVLGRQQCAVEVESFLEVNPINRDF